LAATCCQWVASWVACSKAYMGSGFTPLVVQRNKALYSDIAERLTKQAQLYLNAQGEERQILVNQIANEYDDYAEILIPSKSFVASFV
jgi:hypothetical protein